jgi:hypothetical protein
MSASVRSLAITLAACTLAVSVAPEAMARSALKLRAGVYGPANIACGSLPYSMADVWTGTKFTNARLAYRATQMTANRAMLNVHDFDSGTFMMVAEVRVTGTASFISTTMHGSTEYRWCGSDIRDFL